MYILVYNYILILAISGVVLISLAMNQAANIKLDFCWYYVHTTGLHCFPVLDLLNNT